VNLAIMGSGVMGQLVRKTAAGYGDVDEIFVIEPVLGETLFDIPQPDVIIDFSHPDTLGQICNYVEQRHGSVGVVFATTGFSTEDEMRIEKLGLYAPIIKSYNYSYGVNTLKKILEYAVPFFSERADIEIVEKHHNLKVDSPSGTALMLAEICDPAHERDWIYGRHGEQKREGEIGFHSIRGGTIFGEHTVIFALKDEVIELKHTAFSKSIFAKGAIESALWLNGREPGLYSLEQVFY